MVALSSCTVIGQPSGRGPSATLGVRDIFAEYNLPTLHDHPGDLLWRQVEAVQVLARSRRLGLDAQSGTQAWREADASLARAVDGLDAVALHPQLFSGTRASELTHLLAGPGTCSVRVVSPDLLLDTPIYVLRDGCTLDLGATVLHSQGSQPFQIQIKGRAHVRLLGGVLRGGDWGVSVAKSEDVMVAGMSFHAMAGGGVLVTDSDRITILRNRFSGLGGAGVMLHGSTMHAVVMENRITGDTGWSNWHAGVVITDRNADPSNDATTLLRRDGMLVVQAKITDRVHIPHDNVIYNNDIADNHTSGIYSDGGARNVIVGNRIERNSKEGMCLDNGSTSNVVAYNLFRGNGKRWGMSDHDLQRDFVWKLGRLEDGTSAVKLPAISMDNAAFNQILFNEVDRNFGSGVKMVRSDLFNFVGLNTLTDNNEGSNAKLHYFGILVGYAAADEPAWDLDFVPSRGNEIFNNLVRGNHFAGIYFEDHATDNIVFDNTIFGAAMWAMDSARPQAEQSFNNLTNQLTRNIAAGLDPNLARPGMERRE